MRALVVGNPDFDVPPPQTAAVLETPPAVVASVKRSSVEGGPFRGTAPGCLDFQKLHFDGIPGTGNEVAQVERQIPGATISELMGARASEPSFKQWAPGQTVIHVATHGFFLGGGCDSTTGAAPATASVHEDPLRGEIDRGNPLLLSGLALAGANQRIKAGSDADDGILTSEEIAAMDLSSARWVVLSACETGLGAIQAGEGVLGLRRAFRLAGARTVIMSLWKVDDKATLDWMRRLYEGREAGLSTAEAVRKASLDSLQERRTNGRSTHPYYWGAFVAAGDWR
jgi:CHAT domain-containing protein